MATIPDQTLWVAGVGALGVIATAYGHLRGNWDRALLKSFGTEMSRLQARVVKLETQVETLQRDLDTAQSELAQSQRNLASAIRDRDGHAELAAERAKVILEREAMIARLQLRVEALEAQLKLLGVASKAAEGLSANGGGDGDALHTGDVVVLTKDGLAP